MKKHFYSHIIETSALSLALGELDLSHDERVDLIELTQRNLHHIIMDAILSELSEEDKKQFLEHVASDNHDKVWQLLNTKVDHVEDKIRNAAQELKKELHKDIDQAKRK